MHKSFSGLFGCQSKNIHILQKLHKHHYKNDHNIVSLPDHRPLQDIKSAVQFEWMRKSCKLDYNVFKLHVFLLFKCWKYTKVWTIKIYGNTTMKEMLPLWWKAPFIATWTEQRSNQSLFTRSRNRTIAISTPCKDKHKIWCSPFILRLYHLLVDNEHKET